jgi:predicted small secreted protein
MKRITALILLSALLLLGGCECVKGFGRDMQKAGDWVERKAEEHK